MGERAEGRKVSFMDRLKEGGVGAAVGGVLFGGAGAGMTYGVLAAGSTFALVGGTLIATAATGGVAGVGALAAVGATAAYGALRKEPHSA